MMIAICDGEMDIKNRKHVYTERENMEKTKEKDWEKCKNAKKKFKQK